MRQSTLDWSTCPAFEDIPQNRWLSTTGQTKPLSGYSSRLILLNIIIVFINIVNAIIVIIIK